MRIFIFAANHLRCRKPCWHVKNGLCYRMVNGSQRFAL